MAKKEVDSFVSEMYEKMDSAELKNCIVRHLKEVKSLKAEMKDYNDSIKASIKDLSERIDIVLYWLGVKETEEAKAKLAAGVSEEFSKTQG